ncbi:MAG TPA: GTP cyclohydrolase II [Steroidobacteraceae bacterium]|nr:GTP cyclohydrolase II [Steroidobacteraceae bacterium]
MSGSRLQAIPRAPDPPQGDPALIAVDRALAELRRGRGIVVQEATGRMWRLVAPLETAEEPLLAYMLAQSGAALVVTGERAAQLRVPCESDELLLLNLPAELTAAQLLDLGRHWEADAWRTVLGGSVPHASCADPLAAAAVQLAKSAQLLPALLVTGAATDAAPAGVLAVRVDQVQRYAHPGGEDLVRVSEARVPLRAEEASRVVLFRDRRDASEHVAVIVGHPDPATIVPVRAHSSCFTGDLLGSLRCDCGEQLQTAVQRLHAEGGGVLLYLAQEGRGIGLANKLRAYQLQDEGLDTVDADRHLGFSADERSYAIAAAMLQSLGFTRIRLLTNNPYKVRALRARGIDVAEIESLLAAPNEHNARYIRTKRERAGHLIPDDGE